MTKIVKKRTIKKKIVSSEKIQKLKDKSLLLNGKFEVSTGNYAVLETAVREKANLMFIGDSGIGKTELVYHYCKAKDIPLTILDMGTMTDPITSLIGSHIITVEDGEQKSKFMKSRFSEIIQKPGIVLLDELSRASHSATNILFPCLDFRRELAMEYCFSDCEPIKVHPECIFFATVNIGSQYSGTNRLDRALVDRFMTIKVDNPVSLDFILENTFPTISKDIIERVIAAKVAISKKYKDCECSFDLNLRHIKNICQLINGSITPYDAFYNICNGLSGEDGIKSITSILTKLNESK